MRSILAAIVLAIATASVPAVPTSIEAQAIEFAAGTSSLQGVHGGSLQLHGGDHLVKVGMGFDEVHRAPRLGFSADGSLRGWNWSAGDQTLSLLLPTDLASRSFQITGRGLAVARKGPQGEWLMYGGATSSTFATPFFQTARWERPTGAFCYDRALAKGVRVVSRNVVSTMWTSIQGLEWVPRSTIRFGVSGGLGSDKPFAAGSTELDAGWLHAQASYARAGDGFRRIPVDGFVAREADRERVELQFRSSRGTCLTLNRQHYPSPSNDRSGSGSTVTGGTAGLPFLGVRTQGSLHRSESAGHSTWSYSLGASRQLPRGCEAGVTWFETRLGKGQAIQTLV